MISNASRTSHRDYWGDVAAAVHQARRREELSVAKVKDMKPLRAKPLEMRARARRSR